MQPVDLTTLTAVVHELRSHWLPARCEQIVQPDSHTLCLALRTYQQRGWLTLSWHPQAARLHLGAPPPRQPDTFTFSQQLKHQLNGLALTQIASLAPWERALDLHFAVRPGEPARWHLYAEIMGKYSNVILTNAHQEIVTAAHQVSEQQSRVRPIRTGNRYESPPPMRGALPRLEESFTSWQARISLIPGNLRKMLLQTYGGLSSALIQQMLIAADLEGELTTSELSDQDWQTLFTQWQTWLTWLNTDHFQPGWCTRGGYTVLGWDLSQPAPDVQSLLADYYRDQLNRQRFTQLHHQLRQKLKTLLEKLQQKATGFQTRLTESEHADEERRQADLLMAHLPMWRPGLTAITLNDFETGEPLTIPLNPEKNAVQNAQALYKRHQKLKRARQAVLPLLQAVQTEIHYLEQVEAALVQTADYRQPDDLWALEEIRDELIQQSYLSDPYQMPRPKKDSLPHCHRIRTPGGWELLIGRNNNQNDSLTFKVATDYDLWFHTQEIPGSHVVMRLAPGAVPSDADLAFAADVAAYYSRARQADQVPVVYTEPRHVYKPKGERPGMVIYKHERVLWGCPQRLRELQPADALTPV